jgi:hypothetical protein
MYGTSEGDMWLVDDSEIGVMTTARLPGHHLVMQFMDGEESVFVTDNPEIVAEAERGRERYDADRIAAN